MPRTTVVLLSIDGLRADFYRPDSKIHSPTLCRLAKEGFAADQALPTYPTVTFSVHASIATGCYPDQHGIYGNTRFKTKNGEFRDWILEASEIKVPTIWDYCRDIGKKAALLRWPITVGAKADIVVPEIFLPNGEHGDEDWRLTVENSTPDFPEMIRNKMGAPIPHSHEDYDAWTTEAVCHLLQQRSHDLIMAHLAALDHAQHETGCYSLETRDSLLRVDSLVERIVRFVDPSETVLLIFGDHGFTNFNKRVNINTLFTKRGWITLENDGKTIRDWKVLAHINCGQAAIYCKDEALISDVLYEVRKNAGSAYEVLDRDFLNSLHAFPGALCCIDALDGYSMGENLLGELVTSIESEVRGEHGHGHSPDHPNTYAGLIALPQNQAIKSNKNSVHLRELASHCKTLLSAG